MPSSDFMAGPSALGYLHQVRYALALLIQAPSAESAISIEKFDDVAFEQDGRPTELLQLKHHVSTRGTLTDSSSDLWKTLRAWSQAAYEGTIDLATVILSLATTSTAPTDSAAAHLRPGTGRDEVDALSRLHQAGRASQAETVQRAYRDFCRLSLPSQEELVSRIQVLDQSPDIDRARVLLEQVLRPSTRPQFLAGLTDRLEGWWFARVIQHLQNPSLVPSIPQRLVLIQVRDLADQFRDDNLPIDFASELDMDVAHLRDDERIFVEQLRLVLVSNERIKRAISDYYRAFQQRSRWVREELLINEDLEQYETRLVREWQDLFLRMQEDLPEGADHASVGRALYNQVFDLSHHLPIRPAFPDPFVMRGSFHMLANSLKVGWHPMFRERLAHALERALGAAA